MGVFSTRAVFCALSVAVSFAFLLAKPDSWVAEKCPPRSGDSSPWAWEPLTGTDAVCLDGSQYGVVSCVSPDQPMKTAYIEIQGGGWCYEELDCLNRSATRLGSSSTWPAAAANLTCSPSSNIGYFNLWYGDGASFTGYRSDPWPVPGTNDKLYFRGIRNLDASLDHLFSKYNLADVELLIVTGGSAGGLSTFLHVDHIADRMAAAGSKAVVRGNPVCGYFLDAPNDGSQPMNVTYPLRMQYVYNMQNSTGSLSPECQSVYGIDAWKCIMAPHAAKFVKTPWFAFQSRTDTWQLGNIAMIPCTSDPLKCPTDQWEQIKAYSPTFMDQWYPVMYAPNSKNGAFLDACLIHGSTSSTIDGLTNSQAFQQWLSGGNKSWWTMLCPGPDGNPTDLTGPCDRGKTCLPFPNPPSL